VGEGALSERRHRLNPEEVTVGLGREPLSVLLTPKDDNSVLPSQGPRRETRPPQTPEEVLDKLYLDMPYAGEQFAVSLLIGRGIDRWEATKLVQNYLSTTHAEAPTIIPRFEEPGIKTMTDYKPTVEEAQAIQEALDVKGADVEEAAPRRERPPPTEIDVAVMTCTHCGQHFMLVHLEPSGNHKFRSVAHREEASN